MATLTITPIKTFVSGETVTPAKLNELSQSTVALTAGSIVATDIASDAVTTAKILDATSTTTGVTNAKMRHSAALSVIGRTSDTAGAPADIAAANDGEVFRRSGTAVGFGTVATAGIADDAVTTVKILNANVTPAKLSQPLTLETSKASTSGTSVDFTGIPSWAKRITVMFDGVSTNASSRVLVQIGSGSVTTSGYWSVGYIAGAIFNTTQGFVTAYTNAAAYALWGTVDIVNISSNTYLATSIVGLDFAGVGGGNANITTGAGRVTLGGALDRVRITTVNGTDTFDAGSVNIMYEG
jgi:hypothetical protein